MLERCRRSVDGTLSTLDLAAGDDPRDKAAAFLESHGYPGHPELSELLQRAIARRILVPPSA